MKFQFTIQPQSFSDCIWVANEKAHRRGKAASGGVIG